MRSHAITAITEGSAATIDPPAARSARARPSDGAITASCTTHAMPIHA